MHWDIDVKVSQAAGPGTLTITKAADGTVTIKSDGLAEASVNGNPAMSAEVEDMIHRHEANGHAGTRSRELTQTLIENGWVAKAGPKYLRFIYTGKERRVTLYANSRDIMTREHRELAQALPEAIPTKNEVRWRYDGGSFQDALVAADLLKKFADHPDDEPEDDDAA